MTDNRYWRTHSGISQIYSWRKKPWPYSFLFSSIFCGATTTCIQSHKLNTWNKRYCYCNNNSFIIWHWILLINNSRDRPISNSGLYSACLAELMMTIEAFRNLGVCDFTLVLVHQRLLWDCLHLCLYSVNSPSSQTWPMRPFFLIV